MKQWMQDVIAKCQREGPLTAQELQRYYNADNAPAPGHAFTPGSELVYRLRRHPGVRVTLEGKADGRKPGVRRCNLYMIERMDAPTEPAA